MTIELGDVLHDKLRDALGVGRARQHIFLCAGSGKCASTQECEAAWEFLKKRLKELKLSDVHGQVLRSKVACLRVCQQGPIALIYPAGTWYHSAIPANLEKIIQEHVLNGRVVEELVITQAPLPMEHH